MNEDDDGPVRRTVEAVVYGSFGQVDKLVRETLLYEVGPNLSVQEWTGTTCGPIGHQRDEDQSRDDCAANFQGRHNFDNSH